MSVHTKSLINLLRGWPHPDLLPAARLKPATISALSDTSISTAALEYGPDEGYPPLRESMARLLTNFYAPKQPVTEDRICITGGASQSLACLLQVFTDPLYTRSVWMVAPTYFLACRIFEDSGFGGKLRAVPEDEEGIDIDFLAIHIEKSEEKAMAEGNTVPVYLTDQTSMSSFNCSMLADSRPFAETQTCQTLETYLQASDLCCSHIRKPILTNHVLTSTGTTGPACQKVRRSDSDG